MVNYSSSRWERDASRSSYTAIAATLFLALSLEFFPWPVWIKDIKPLFPDLALVYWVIYCPRIINYTAALALGVVLDLAGQLPLGFTALSYTVVVLLTNGIRGRFSLLGPFGQAVHVLFVLVCGQTILLLLKLFESGDWLHWHEQFRWRLFWPSFHAAALWLFLPLLARRFSRLWQQS